MLCVMKRSLMLSLLGVVVIAGGGCSSDVQPDMSTQSREQGMVLFKRGDYDDALGAFRNAVRQEPRDFRSYYYLGWSYEALKDYQQAILSYKSCVNAMEYSRYASKYPEYRQKAMNSLATLLARRDEMNLEKDLLKQQVTDQKLGEAQRADAAFVLAKTYRTMGDADSAARLYASAAAIGEDDVTIQKEAGLYFKQLGRPAQAEKCLDRAKSLYIWDSEVNSALKEVRETPLPSGGAAAPLSPEMAPPADPIVDHVGK